MGAISGSIPDTQRSWKLVISDVCDHNYCYANHIIVQAAIEAHSER